MRLGSLTADEMFAAEKAADERKQHRLAGFAKGKERDQYQKVLSNGVMMIWHVDKELNERTDEITMDDGRKVSITTYPPNIPEDKFALVIDGKEHYFDTDEFKKWLRWA